MLKLSLAAGLALICLTLAARAEPSNLNAPNAYRAAQAGEITLIDVRRYSEWRASGMPDGAIGITLQDRDFIDQVLTRVGGDKTAPIALICRTGRRSLTALNRLEAVGFTSVYNVKEGVSGRPGAGPGWYARQLPVKQHPTH